MDIQKIKKYLNENGQRIFNFYLFLNFLGYSCWHFYSIVHENRVDFVEVTFILQNFILTAIILLRKPHKSIDKNLFHQLIASIAFFSGVLFLGQEPTSNENLHLISSIVIFISLILGITTLFNLGKSFGILIAFRKVKTNGLYSIVRHPMYFTDILMRVGFVISHPNWFTIIAFVLSTACYVYRALLEEKFLKQQPEYLEYMQRTKYRFIPYIF
jgi:protein-S-isoprenylcysteine O-methyltransferase Ste14